MTNKKFYISSVLVVIITVFVALNPFITVRDEWLDTYMRITSIIMIMLSLVVIFLSGKIAFGRGDVLWLRLVCASYVIGSLIFITIGLFYLFISGVTIGGTL